MVRRLRQTSKIVNPDDYAFTGSKYSEEVSLQLFTYNENNINEQPTIDSKQLPKFEDINANYWLNIYGIHEPHTIRTVCNHYNIHRLVARDIIDTNQRAKLQEFDKTIFFSIDSILPGTGTLLEPEQISFVLFENGLISFQERKGDHFNHIRERLRNKIGLVRSKPIDFLLFLLLEAIIHNYFESIDFIEEQVDRLMEKSSEWSADISIINQIEKHKKDLYKLHKLIKPLKEALTSIDKLDNSLIRVEQRSYFFDLKDQTSELIESIDSLRYRLESAVNLYFSMQGHKMNQIMKTLTVVATIFIPLTFIVGVYGMNFKYMPELNYKWGYFAVWGVMALTVVAMIIFFRWKKWD